MRIFLAGATGVIGVRMTPLLVAAGHIVAGMTRSQPELVERLGAEPVVCDAYDAIDLRDAVRRFAPDIVVHQLTDLPDSVAELGAARAANQRMRNEGTHNLLAAAAGAKVVAQSTAFPASGREDHERLVLGAGGVVLRYDSSTDRGRGMPTRRPRHCLASTSTSRRAARSTPWTRHPAPWWSWSSPDPPPLSGRSAGGHRA